MLVQVAEELLLLVVCCFAPGFYFVRRLPWTPLEKLCGSIGLSIILLYLAMWGIFCFGPQDERILCWVVVGCAVALAAAAWKDLLRLAASFRIRQSLRWFGVLAVWTALMLAIIRLYSGAGWGGDWLEHFQRTLLFMKRIPLHTLMVPNVPLTARPPLMNVLAAFFLTLTEDRFELFQVVFAFLNLFVFLSCLLILPALGGTRRRMAVPLVVLFAASPVVMEAVTYTWTKAVPAFYVILALSLYLSGLRKNDRLRIVAAFVSLCGGLLVHYSVGPYIVFLTLHYGIHLIRRRDWRQAVAIGALCGFLLGTWFIWAAAVYGTKSTLESNTSVSSARDYHGSNLVKVGANVFDTIVPVWIRGGFPHFELATGEPAIRDSAFIFYQLNLIFAMGVVGGPLVVWLLILSIRHPQGSTWERRFWYALIPACVVIGIAVVGERDVNGVPHLTLLSMEVLGLSFLASRFLSLRVALRLLLIAGCALDFYFGVLLQARVEGLENTADHQVFPDMLILFGKVPGLPGALEGRGVSGTVSKDMWTIWAMKHGYELSARQLITIPQQYHNRKAFPELWPQIKAQLDKPIADDAHYWGGWASRHGGAASYLGDWVAGESGQGTSTATVLFCLMFAGLLFTLAYDGQIIPHRLRPEFQPVQAGREDGGGKRMKKAQRRVK